MFSCDWCEKPAVVVCNGLHSCSDHMDSMFHLALEPARLMMRNYRETRGDET